MKKSEFLEQIRTGKHPTDKHETVFEYFAREAVIAAETAGVVWDPEEEPLPERLTIFSDLCIGMQYGPEGKGWIKAGYVYPDHQRAAEEAVRRYNAWPALIAAIEPASYMDEAAVLRRLNEAWKILRGGAS